MRYQTHGRARKGVASNYAASAEEGRARARQAETQQALHPARAAIATSSWSAPAPASRRSAPSCRSAARAQAKGRNWLFFGDRTFTHDFLYQIEWQDALKDGGLTRMDVAFSRDTPEKVYVQHRIWEKRRDLVEWLDGGATLLRLRRHERDGEGRARHAGARLSRT